MDHYAKEPITMGRSPKKESSATRIRSEKKDSTSVSGFLTRSEVLVLTTGFFLGAMTMARVEARHQLPYHVPKQCSVSSDPCPVIFRVHLYS